MVVPAHIPDNGIQAYSREFGEAGQPFKHHYQNWALIYARNCRNRGIWYSRPKYQLSRNCERFTINGNMRLNLRISTAHFRATRAGAETCRKSAVTCDLGTVEIPRNPHHSGGLETTLTSML
jgi:hypothetical protein